MNILLKLFIAINLVTISLIFVENNFHIIEDHISPQFSETVTSTIFKLFNKTLGKYFPLNIPQKNSVSNSISTKSSSFTIAKMESKPWESALDSLPKPITGSPLPVFFFAHGSPMLIYPKHLRSPFQGLVSIGGPDGPNSQFLQYFGKVILEKYNPKAIVVFSAHWETDREIEVTSYTSNPLLYDYYGFPPEMYKISWNSKGSSEVANRVVELLKKNNIPARALTQGRGLDHGVFVPFTLMFPQNDKNDTFPIPVIEVSMHSNLDPQKLIELGKAVQSLREEGILILSGGLTIHTFQEMDAWNPSTSPQGFKDFEKSVVNAINNNKDSNQGEKRNEDLKKVTTHPYFKRAHPRAEHFVPIYIAAGAGANGSAKMITELHGALSIAFGL